ncbi:MAG: rhomboid family intramembrane serine protease [Taibaiella sp.]|nr:rhomboid family intramembrane serine protease [Taibaiella sp.]
MTSGRQALPPVVKNLIIINTLMVLIQYVLGKQGIDLADTLGLHYWKSPLFKWWQPFTHMFMHGSYNDVSQTLEHLFFNMFALWMFGRILENYWGAQRFLFFYLVCGLGAAFCHLAVMGYHFHTLEQAFQVYQQSPTLDHYNLFITQHNMESIPKFIEVHSVWQNDPSSVLQSNESIYWIHKYMLELYNEATVGASGAVFGVLFAFGYLFPNALLYFFALVPIKAKWAVTIYAAIELFSGIRNSAGDNVAHFAHLGGMLFAFLLLKIWSNKSRNRIN